MSDITIKFQSIKLQFWNEGLKDWVTKESFHFDEEEKAEEAFDHYTFESALQWRLVQEDQTLLKESHFQS